MKKNNNQKTWKKSHRYRRKKKMKIMTFHFEGESLEKLTIYCERHHLSPQKAIKRVLQKGIEQWKMK